jgi:holo-[acyl-carrier protein] synthase
MKVIVGLGMDVVEIARIQRMLDGPGERAERFLARCFTAAERATCDAAHDRAARYAARFAAKEAASKSLGAPRGIGWHDVEVLRGSSGSPALALSGAAAEEARRRGAARALVTMTHDGGVAAATVILDSEGEER